MNHHVTQTQQRVLRRKCRKLKFKMDANGNIRSFEWSESVWIEESDAGYDFTSAPLEPLQVNLTDQSSSTSSGFSQSNRLNGTLGFFGRL